VKESKIKIMVTKDYSIFKTQKGNRDVFQKDVKKVEDKILVNNLLDYHPILVDSNMMVIDGQHRLEVAKKNNLYISFIKVKKEKAGLKTTQSINTTGKAWTVRDFLKSYIELGCNEYIRFNNILNKYKFLTISQLIELGSSQKAESFREGDYKFTTPDDVLIKALDDISLYSSIGINLPKRTHFQRWMLLTIKRGIVFDHTRMVKKLSENIDIVKRLPSDCYIYSDTFGEIYNHRLTSKNVINFNLRLIK
jgi:hypothetical protein